MMLTLPANIYTPAFMMPSVKPFEFGVELRAMVGEEVYAFEKSLWALRETHDEIHIVRGTPFASSKNSAVLQISAQFQFSMTGGKLLWSIMPATSGAADPSAITIEADFDLPKEAYP